MIALTSFFWGSRLAKRLSRTAVLSLEFNRSYETKVSELLELNSGYQAGDSEILSLDSATEQGLTPQNIENLRTLMDNRIKGYFCLDSMSQISDPEYSDARVIASLKSRGGVIGSFLFFRRLVSVEKFSAALRAAHPLPALQIRCGDLSTEMTGLAEIVEKREEWVVFSDCDARELLQQQSQTKTFHWQLSASGERSSQDLDDLLEMAAHSQVFLLKLNHKHRVSGFGVLALTIWMAKSPFKHVISGKFLAPYWQLWKISPKLAAASLALSIFLPLRLPRGQKPRSFET
jgi:hypothetical protein